MDSPHPKQPNNRPPQEPIQLHKKNPMSAHAYVSESLGLLELDAHLLELHAHAEATTTEDTATDDSPRPVTFTLGCSLLPVHAPHESPTIPPTPDWLPPQETLHEHLSPNETGDCLHEIFAHWVERLRNAVPPQTPLHAPSPP